MLGIASAAFSHESPPNAPRDSSISAKGDKAGKTLALVMRDGDLAQILALSPWACHFESWVCHIPVVQP